MTGSLQRSAAAFVGAALLLAVGANTAVLTYAAYHRYQDEVVRRAESQAQSFVREVNRVVALGMEVVEIPELDARLQQIARADEGVARVSIHDVTGAELFSSHQDALPDALNVAAAIRNTEGKRLGEVRLDINPAYLHAELRELIQLSVVVGVTIFVLSLLLVFYVVNVYAIAPIAKLREVAAKVASGDLTARVESSGGGELRALGDTINEMGDQLKVMVAEVSGLSGGVSRVSDAVAESCGSLVSLSTRQKAALQTTSAVFTQMSFSISGLADSAVSLKNTSIQTSQVANAWDESTEGVLRGSEVFLEQAESTVGSISSVIDSAEEVAGNAERLVESAESTADSLSRVETRIGTIRKRADESASVASRVSEDAVQRGKQVVNQAVEEMDDLRDHITELGAVIAGLGKRSEEIGAILNVVNDVARETSMLSLNAAILAARAGHEGRAFAVVAEQIKELADRTGASTKQIGVLINNVQIETKASVQLAEQGIDAVKHASETVVGVEEALDAVVQSASLATDSARGIQNESHDMGQVVEQATLAVRHMTREIQDIRQNARQQRELSWDVAKAAEKIRSMARELRENTEGNMSKGRALTKLSGNLSHQAERIGQMITQNKDRTFEVAEAVQELRDATDELSETADLLENGVKDLGQEASALNERVGRITI